MCGTYIEGDNKCNFYRYIKRKYRSCEEEYRIYTTMMIPLTVGAFSSMIAVYIKENHGENEMLFLIISTIIAYTILMTKQLLRVRDRIEETKFIRGFIR